MRALPFLLALLMAGPLIAKSGTLVIVGGGLSPDNAEIYRAFIDEAKGGTIAVIPSASGEPQASLDAFAANLMQHGVERVRIIEVHLAEVDDPGTTIDEAAWSANAGRAEEVAKIDNSSAIWFTGGDQARTTRLLTANGKDSPMLSAIRKRLAAGAVVGGTSAGAAIMGTGMIVCGDPRRANDAISSDPVDCAALEGHSEPLVLGKGLGFLPGHVIDQHFSQRGRLPRLLRAMACGAGQGIGIDEDTALVVDLEKRRATVVGTGRVTVVKRPRPRTDCAVNFGMIDLGLYRAGQSFELRQ